MFLITSLLIQTISLGNRSGNTELQQYVCLHDARRASHKLQNPGNLQVIFSPWWQINSLTSSFDRAQWLIWHQQAKSLSSYHILQGGSWPKSLSALFHNTVNHVLPAEVQATTEYIRSSPHSSAGLRKI